MGRLHTIVALCAFMRHYRGLITSLDDVLGGLLGVTEHHRVVAVKQRIVDAALTRCQRALDEHHSARLPDLQNRHAVDRRGLVFFRGRVGDVIGDDHEGDIGLREFGVDVLEFVTGSISLLRTDRARVLSGYIEHCPVVLARGSLRWNGVSSTHPSLATSFRVSLRPRRTSPADRTRGRR